MAKKKGGSRNIFLGLLALVLLMLLFAFFKNKNKKEGLEVEVGKVEKRTIYEKVSASGKIFPETEVKITSDVSGEIVALNVEEGDSVTVSYTHLTLPTILLV